LAAWFRDLVKRRAGHAVLKRNRADFNRFGVGAALDTPKINLGRFWAKFGRFDMLAWGMLAPAVGSRFWRLRLWSGRARGSDWPKVGDIAGCRTHCLGSSFFGLLADLISQ